MEKYDALIFGHKNPDTDSICASLVQEKYNKNNGWNTKAVRLGNINKETEYVLKYLGIDAPKLINEVADGQDVILVDHNAFAQSVNNIENAHIQMVVDHHRISNFETKEPLYYIAKPYGCTCTILFEEFKNANMKIEKKEALLMLSAIVSDTLLFKSPTCTKYDVEAAKELGKIAEVDVQTYGLDMLKAGTDLSDFSPSELINIDSKEFVTGNYKFQVAQINVTSIEDVLENKSSIEKAMENFMTENGTNLFIFLITDILNNDSQSIVLGDTKLFEKAFGQTVENNMALLEGVVSRKKQIVPVILEALEKMGN